MEILSTGEKIKRSRIYKGVTLKELCDDKISISKMSCIENGKVKPDRWILDIVAQKLDLDIKYLLKDVREQLVNNLSQFEEGSRHRDFEKDVKINLNYALDYKYYDLAFKLMHILFEFYIEQGKDNKIQNIVTDYYEVAQKNEQVIEVFYRDMATYFYRNREYVEALTYYNRLRLNAKWLNVNLECELLYSEASCYTKMGYHNKAYDMLEQAQHLYSDIENNIIKGKILTLFFNLSIKLKKSINESLIDRIYELLVGNSKVLATSRFSLGESFFVIGDRVRAIKEIKEAIYLFSKESRELYGDFLNKCTGLLIKNNELEEAESCSDNALNIAINCDNIKLIERAYYLKAIIFQKRNLYSQSEMYMNLSMDALMKFGNYEQRYKRYLEMANMYYELKEIRESLKYFTLAMNLEKKL
ncbi:tetratricopeptide repeat protein [Clostridium polyendosporum]|uniref:Tetratricopeptide repeat protein n=1 Tax=Clostridium polyendosporum TaxID=69208 RepID=A0A919RXB8_9CLOT|nr:helix-turn-helix transcriptional regulator [Clostridium polyendosporum]GIM27499.1 tetratricopeptide repeat protein [Clostridium polyendosporum]